MNTPLHEDRNCCCCAPTMACRRCDRQSTTSADHKSARRPLALRSLGWLAGWSPPQQRPIWTEDHVHDDVTGNGGWGTRQTTGVGGDWWFKKEHHTNAVIIIVVVIMVVAREGNWRYIYGFRMESINPQRMTWTVGWFVGWWVGRSVGRPVSEWRIEWGS